MLISLLQPLQLPQLLLKPTATHATLRTKDQTPTGTTQETVLLSHSDLLNHQLMLPPPEVPLQLPLLQPLLFLKLNATHAQLALLERTHITISKLAVPLVLQVLPLQLLLLQLLLLPQLSLKPTATHATFQMQDQTPTGTIQETPRLSHSERLSLQLLVPPPPVVLLLQLPLLQPPLCPRQCRLTSRDTTRAL
jgi:hypothetical protein